MCVSCNETEIRRVFAEPSSIQSRFLTFAPGPLSLKVAVAISTFNCLNVLESWLWSSVPLGGAVHSSNIVRFFSDTSILCNNTHMVVPCHRSRPHPLRRLRRIGIFIPSKIKANLSPLQTGYPIHSPCSYLLPDTLPPAYLISPLPIQPQHPIILHFFHTTCNSAHPRTYPQRHRAHTGWRACRRGFPVHACRSQFARR